MKKCREKENMNGIHDHVTAFNENVALHACVHEPVH